MRAALCKAGFPPRNFAFHIVAAMEAVAGGLYPHHIKAYLIALPGIPLLHPWGKIKALMCLFF